MDGYIDVELGVLPMKVFCFYRCRLNPKNIITNRVLLWNMYLELRSNKAQLTCQKHSRFIFTNIIVVQFVTSLHWGQVTYTSPSGLHDVSKVPRAQHNTMQIQLRLKPTSVILNHNPWIIGQILICQQLDKTIGHFTSTREAILFWIIYKPDRNQADIWLKKYFWLRVTVYSIVGKVGSKLWSYPTPICWSMSILFRSKCT